MSEAKRRVIDRLPPKFRRLRSFHLGTGWDVRFEGIRSCRNHLPPRGEFEKKEGGIDSLRPFWSIPGPAHPTGTARIVQG